MQNGTTVFVPQADPKNHPIHTLPPRIWLFRHLHHHFSLEEKQTASVSSIFSIIQILTTNANRLLPVVPYVARSGQEWLERQMTWALGMINAMYVFGVADRAIHIAEEMSQPGKI